jgi:ribosome-associated translation inhibitor RaiA
MKRLTQLCLASFVIAAAAPHASAQIDPGEAVRKIAETIEKEMSEIDRLLRESSRSGGANAEASAKIRELIDGTRQSQSKVVQGIDDLVEELEKMAQQNQSQQQQQQQQQDQQQQGQQGQQGQQQQGQQGQQQGQQGNRRENQTPDLAQQPGQEPGQQQGQQQGQQDQPQQQSGRADSPGDDPQREGQNTQAGTAAEGGTERVERGEGAEGWGSLQKYVPPQYQRAGAPQVPARYRRLHEAFQKRAHQTQKSGG